MTGPKVLLLSAAAAFTSAHGTAQAMLYEIKSTSSVPLGSRWQAVNDMTGDGVSDLISAGTNRVDLFSGKDGSHVKRLAALPTGWTSFAAGPDVNGDKSPDFVVGWQRLNRVELRNGSDGSVIKTWTKAASIPGFGAFVGFTDDVDGDGAADLVAVASGKPSADKTKAVPGSIEVYSSRRGVLLKNTALPGNLEFAGARSGVDLDGDGTRDVLFATVNLFYGSGRWGNILYSLPEIRVWSWKTGKLGLFLFGRSVWGHGKPFSFVEAGDLNRDGITEILAGLSGQGPLSVYSGKDAKVLKAHPLKSFFLGQSVLGDLDGDRVPEYAVGDASSGNVVVFRGATHTELWAHASAVSPCPSCLFFSCGDLDGDGIPELAVGTGQTLRVFTYRRNEWKGGFAALLNPSGPGSLGPGYLRGRGQPVLGRTLSLQCQAPGYDFAILFLGLRPHIGDLAPFPGNPILFYIDKRYLIGVTIPFSLVAGSGGIAVALPRDGRLLRLPIAFQAAVFALKGAGAMGATNLVLARLGLDYAAGRTLFPLSFSLQAPPLANFKDRLGRPVTLYRNTGAAHSLFLEGSKAVGEGPIEIRTGIGQPPGGGGFRLGTIQKMSGSFNLRVWIPPGRGSPIHVYLWNADPKNTARITLRAIRIE